jgi:hypothetical protein
MHLVDRSRFRSPTSPARRRPCCPTDPARTVRGQPVELFGGTMNRAPRGRLRPWCRATGWTAVLTVLLMPVVFLASATAARGDYPPEPPPPQKPVHVVATPPPTANPRVISPQAGEQGVRIQQTEQTEQGVRTGGQGGLARTGAEIALYVSVGLTLIAVGSVVLVAARTRSHPRRSARDPIGSGDF